MTNNAGSTDRAHPVVSATARIHHELDVLVDQSVWSLDAETTRATMVELTRLAARVSELEARVARHGDQVEVADPSGATSTPNWWAHATRLSRPEAHRKMRLAAALDSREAIRHALAAGDLLVDQARVIADALDALPADLEPEVLDLAEKTLLAEAAHHDAKALKILGRRILDVIAPEVGEAHEAQLLDAEEKKAAQACRLTMSEDGHGQVHGRFTLPAVQGAMLKKALLAIVAPKHQSATTGTLPEPRPTAERMGHAFAEYVERYPVDRLPDAGGIAATVVVTMTLESLTGGLAAASLDTGERLSAGQARRLACEAGVIPAVLGTDSVVLDLGRQTRFHTKPQRIALGLAQGGCTAEGCDWPPGLCHAHHETPFSQGGDTSVKNGRLLCPRHHARAHDPTYETRANSAGKVSFHRRV